MKYTVEFERVHTSTIFIEIESENDESLEIEIEKMVEDFSLGELFESDIEKMAGTNFEENDDQLEIMLVEAC